MKLKLSVLFAFMLVFGFTGISLSYPGVNYTEYTLYAGQNLDVGKIIVENDGDYLYVAYELHQSAIDDGWGISETHLHVGETLGDFPLNKKGNPKIGNFEYSMEHNPAVSEYEYMIPMTWEVDDEILVAAHAVVTDAPKAQWNGEIYATRISNGTVGLYEIDVVTEQASLLLELTGGIGDVDNGTGYANGMAYDAANNVIYFTAPANASTPPSPLWKYDLNTLTLTKLGVLSDIVVGASFYNGEYYFQKDFTDDMYKLDLNNPLSTDMMGYIIPTLVYADFSPRPGTDFSFGDFAIAADGMLYGSTRVTKFFYSLDLSNGTYYEFMGSNALDLQLAFGSNGILYGVRHSTGEFWEVDTATGNAVKTGWVVKGFADLASGMLYVPNDETAWGNGTYFGGGSWAMYFGYTITGLVVPDPVDPNANWVGHTAWGGDTLGDGNAWWYYFDTAGPATQDIYAGQALAGGATSVSYMNGKIIIDLDPDYITFDPNKTDNVKIQGYNGSVPGSRPAAGLFTTFKGTYSDSDTHIEIPVSAFEYYAIHIDVLVKEAS